MASQSSIVDTAGGFSGAGAGGGLGLNAPGAGLYPLPINYDTDMIGVRFSSISCRIFVPTQTGPKVQHMSGSGVLKGLTISDELRTVWDKIFSDDDPTTWVYCEYDSSGEWSAPLN
jgi:hypothetical protein